MKAFFWASQGSGLIRIDVDHALRHVGQTVPGRGEGPGRGHHEVLRLGRRSPLFLPLPEQRFASSRLLRRRLFLLRTRTLAPLLRFVVARVAAAAKERAQDVHRHREDDGRVLLVADGAQSLETSRGSVKPHILQS